MREFQFATVLLPSCGRLEPPIANDRLVD